MGLSVSKRVGTAVTRNGVRRRLKEIFRSSVEDLPSGVDLVISARPAAAEASFDELSEEFFSSVGRLSKSGEARSGGGS